jgi:ABC-type transporter Mla subunit MlaD
MTLPVIVMNATLMVLLLAALAFGWRLDQRLKALKASHESFAKAVADLDGAAARAEQGLADLRGATEEASERLQERIETARRLAGRLDAALHAAPTLEAQAEARAKDKAAKVSAERPLTLFEPRDARPAPQPAAQPFRAPEPARSRARIDDDLFEPEAGARLTTILGGRR